MEPDRLAGVVLAAGQGRRFGGFKALALLDGETLLARAVTALRTAGVEQVLVVAHPDWPWVPAVDSHLVTNPGWPEGMGSSLRVALAHPLVAEAAGAVLMLADTPLIGAECVRRVVARAGGPAALVQATYGDRRGHPVLVGREHFAGVAALAHGDAGARDYLAAHPGELTLVECSDVGDPTDVDTPAELARLEKT